MFSQQVVSKVYIADAEGQVLAAGHTDYWSTAESYYGQGHFQPAAFFCACSGPPERGAETAETNSVVIPPATDDVEDVAEPEDAAPAAATAPVAAAPVPEDPAPPVADSVPEVTPEPQPLLAPAQPAEPAAVVSDPVQPLLEAPAASEPEQKLAPGEIDVLPLPMPSQSNEGVAASDSEKSPRRPAPPQIRMDRRDGTPESYSYDSDAASPHMTPHRVSPEELVRQRAIERAKNRRLRIETRKWLGYDPLRPAVNAMPYTTTRETRPAYIIVPMVAGDQQNRR